LINWATSTALPSGILAEQVDPADKTQVGVSPLVWSHAELADTLLLFYKTSDEA
jgi:glucoamylase